MDATATRDMAIVGTDADVVVRSKRLAMPAADGFSRRCVKPKAAFFIYEDRRCYGTRLSNCGSTVVSALANTALTRKSTSSSILAGLRTSVAPFGVAKPHMD
jgi:hypothetical protein